MGWEIAVTLAAVALLALLHVYAAAEEGAQVEGNRISAIARDLAGGRDPWTRLLVFGALAAALFALGVVAVPALFGNDEESAPATRPTVTTPTTSTAPTTATTTTAPTTTTPTKTIPTGPPRGTVLIAETAVRGSNGQVLQSYSRVGTAPVVRVVDAGVYRVLVPGLGPDARGRAKLRVRAGAGTDVQVRQSPGSPAFVVSTRDAATGKPAARDFLLVVYGPPRDARRQHERHLPKTT
jgi:cytoskeletal protein RodZ